MKLSFSPKSIMTAVFAISGLMTFVTASSHSSIDNSNVKKTEDSDQSKVNTSTDSIPPTEQTDNTDENPQQKATRDANSGNSEATTQQKSQK